MLTRNIAYLTTIHGIKKLSMLAEALEIPLSTLQQLTSGEDPKYSTLKTIAEYFGRTPTELMECDLGEHDGARPYVHHIRPFDDIPEPEPEPKFRSLPADARAAVISTYAGIVAGEIRLQVAPEAIERQALALEKLAETLVNGFSDLVGS
ncbi:helix-turn-helix transcriptional regulator [Xenorhabdus sp. 18]|uniref:helix-turn-helix transcriptional regulator n=1 Tax=Xenorhabdus doucetiae TaxID=351671 RepID=UPI0019BEF255|nr:helix-turn-helix transcriptional regulator [Xenorhabdus sp. 18]MBD2797214.1 helix-turn-helix transcriptional regulator [Xenorhabdus sp. 18]